MIGATLSDPAARSEHADAPHAVALLRSRRANPSPPASSRGSTSRAGISPASPSTNPRCQASGLNCSRRSRPRSSGPPSCSILTPLKYRLICRHLRWRRGDRNGHRRPWARAGGGLVVMPDPFAIVHRALIISAATARRSAVIGCARRIPSSAARADPKGPAAEVVDTAVGKAVSRRQT
jgi:hypothetical protein